MLYPPDSLEADLSIDVPTMDSEFTAKRREAVRKRFLAGLYKGLASLPESTPIWMALGHKSSTHWVLCAPTPDEHDAFLKAAKTPEEKALKAFFRELGTTRSAISSATRDSAFALSFTLPGWEAPCKYSAGELVWTLSFLLSSSQRLLDQDVRQMHAQWLDRRLPEAPVRSGPRL